MKFLGYSSLLLLAVLVPTFSFSPDNELCDGCKKIVLEIRDYLDNNEHDILIELSKVCNLLFSGDELSACSEYVNTFGSLIIEDAIKMLDEGLVCDEYLKMCTSDMYLKFRQPDNLISEKDTAPCILCKWAVFNIQNLIIKNNSRGEIEKELVELCDKLPLNATLKLGCKAFMMTTGRELVDMLFNGTLAEDVCKEVGWCPASKVLKYASNIIPDLKSQAIRKLSKNSTLCEICMDIVVQLREAIQNNQDTIRDYVNMICHRLPVPFDTECLDLVDEQFDSIIEEVIQYLKQPVCTELNICSASKTFIIN